MPNFTEKEDKCLREWLAIPANKSGTNRISLLKALTKYLHDQGVSPVIRTFDEVQNQADILESETCHG
jgi:hypothetical protein